MRNSDAVQRRELGQLALAGLPSAAAFLVRLRVRSGARQAGVEVGGCPGRNERPVQLGMGNYPSGDEILTRCVQLGVSGVELRMQPVELFLGSPDAIAGAAAAARGRAEGGGGRGRGRAGGGRAALTPEQEAAQKPPPRRRGNRHFGADEQGEGIPQDIQRRRRRNRDREGGRHLRLHGRRGQLPVRAGQTARRAGALDRNLGTSPRRRASASSPTSTR